MDIDNINHKMLFSILYRLQSIGGAKTITKDPRDNHGSHRSNQEEPTVKNNLHKNDSIADTECDILTLEPPNKATT